uniref:Lipocalin/cytosolic fatty-acid binding domain-containing protein n=1 Tax=viral metagenome TaxID=1070528 RepID=A0A6C0JG38_9ZZZZ
MNLWKSLYFLFATVSVSGFRPETVPELDIDKYTGRWYQVLGAPTNQLFQGYGSCITADYGVLSNGSVSVLNCQLDKNENLEEISGYAYYKNLSEPGKLTVYLQGTPFDGPYWVVKLGETKNKQYQYSIITVPSQISLWVLARNVDEFYNEYAQMVTNYLDTQNYHYETILQDDTCKYSSV